MKVIVFIALSKGKSKPIQGTSGLSWSDLNPGGGLGWTEFFPSGPMDQTQSLTVVIGPILSCSEQSAGCLRLAHSFFQQEPFFA